MSQIHYQNILSHCDHTLLSPQTTSKDIIKICKEAEKFRCASVCIPSCYVKEAVNYLNGKIPVCTVVGFPNGYSSTAAKLAEVETAIREGASEIDLVLNLGQIKERNNRYIQKELEKVKFLLQLHEMHTGEHVILKAIIEIGLWNEDDIKWICHILNESSVDFAKTSTGFLSRGATIEDIFLLRKYLDNKIQIKASGGIHTFKEAEKLLEAGATRIGTSRLVSVAQEKEIL